MSAFLHTGTKERGRARQSPPLPVAPRGIVLTRLGVYAVLAFPKSRYKNPALLLGSYYGSMVLPSDPWIIPLSANRALARPGTFRGVISGSARMLAPKAFNRHPAASTSLFSTPARPRPPGPPSTCVTSRAASANPPPVPSFLDAAFFFRLHCPSPSSKATCRREERIVRSNGKPGDPRAVHMRRRAWSRCVSGGGRRAVCHLATKGLTRLRQLGVVET